MGQSARLSAFYSVKVSNDPMAIATEGLEETATIMGFHGGKVVSMEDYRTEADAVKTVGSV
jgi:hypothetical protein